jgi:pyruvate/2-oxoglutarate dehydrogenase complex dihydrolipoamide acyltransferase (E2) component
MPLKRIDVENETRNSISIGPGLGLKPGQRVEVEVSSATYDEITNRDGLALHSVSDPYATSEVDGPEDPDAVASYRQELAERADSVRETNQEVYAYDSARVKATQLGIDLNDVLEAREEFEVPYLGGEYGKVTIQELIQYVSRVNDSPYEGPVPGGARTSQRSGRVPKEGKVANYRPNYVGHPTPVQDGFGKPAEEGHTVEGIHVDSEGNTPIRRDTGEESPAVGTQDEFKPHVEGDEREYKVESAPVMGHEPVPPENPVSAELYNPRTEPRSTDEDSDEEAAPDLPHEQANATPAARARAAEFNVDLRNVEGTGRDDAILVRDVEDYAASVGAEERGEDE